MSKRSVNDLPSTIIVIQGTVGSGKTLLLTYFILRYLRLGVDAYSQNQIEGARDLDTLMGLKRIKKAVVAVDDAITEGLDSYGQMSSSGRLTTRMLRFANKRGLILLFTQQIETGIAKRLRRITNYIFEMEKLVFPYFHVMGYTQKGVCFFDKVIKFHPAVYNAYETEEEVYQDVLLGDLEQLFTLSRGNRTTFKALIQSRYSLSNELQNVIHECMSHRNIEAMDEVLNDWGFTLIV